MTATAARVEGETGRVAATITMTATAARVGGETGRVAVTTTIPATVARVGGEMRTAPRIPASFRRVRSRNFLRTAASVTLPPTTARTTSSFTSALSAAMASASLER